MYTEDTRTDEQHTAYSEPTQKGSPMPRKAEYLRLMQSHKCMDCGGERDTGARVCSRCQAARARAKAARRAAGVRHDSA